MQRVPEPELMGESEQARAYAEADFSEAHDRFVRCFQERFPDETLRGAVVLDLGCGPADVTVRFARAFPQATVHGVDGSEPMLEHGRARVQREGLSDRVQLTRAIIPHAPPPLPEYDAMISNSLLHHLPEPADLWETVHQYATSGAPVFVVDLRRPAEEADVARLVDAHAADAPDVLRRDFHASLRAAFTPEEVQHQLAAAHLSSALRVEVVSDRHLAVAGRAP